jgi:hypothetical protein
LSITNPDHFSRKFNFGFWLKLMTLKNMALAFNFCQFEKNFLAFGFGLMLKNSVEFDFWLLVFRYPKAEGGGEEGKNQPAKKFVFF